MRSYNRKGIKAMNEFVDPKNNRFIAERNIAVGRKDFKYFIQNAAADANNYLTCDKMDEIFSDNFEIIIDRVSSGIRKMIAEADIYRRDHVLNDDAQYYLDGAQFDLGSLDLDVRNLCRMLSDRRKREAEHALCEPVAACDVLKEYVQRVNEHMPERNVFDVRFVNNTKKAAYIRIPTREFTLILTNFVVNAMKHSHTADKRIDIILNCINKSDKVAVSVLDYGVGVDLDSVKARLSTNIERFIRNNSISRYSGNGLIVCSKLAQEMNSRILVLNYPGAGAVFTLLFSRIKEYPFSRYISLSDSDSAIKYVDDNLIYTALRAALRD